jgi:hypothetical protein
VDGFATRDGEAFYSIASDGVDFGEEKSTGWFAFTEDLYQKEAFVRIRVNRPYMDERVYSLHVIRISDAMIWNLRLKSSTTAVAGDPGIFNPLSPGYQPEKPDYQAKVNAQADKLQLWTIRKPGVYARYRYKSELDADYGAWDSIPEGVELTDPVDFDPDAHFIIFEIQVVLPDPQYPVGPGDLDASNPPNPIIPLQTYTLRALHPSEVEFDPDAAYGEFMFTLNGGPRFNAGNPVSFYLTPPFGTKTSTVTYTSAGEGTKNLDPSPSHQYAFIMPSGDVHIKAEYVPVDAVLGVRYVWEGGAPFTTTVGQNGDAKTWATATSDLQALMDAFNPADPPPNNHESPSNNYEIWIARGTLTPDWTSLPSGSWASDLALSSVKSQWWSFVLTDKVKIFGGFDGTEESPAQKETRDRKKNQTILSGKLGDNGTVLHALVASGISGARVEGLTVRGGYNVIGLNNTYSINGKTIYGAYGGALYAVDAQVLFKNVDFEYGLTDYAAGIALRGNAAPVLINCTVSRSQSANYGSGIGLLDNSRLVMVGGALSLNWDAGGVIGIGGSAQAVLVNLSVTNNNDNPVMITGSGKGIFINASITGNRGISYAEAPYTIGTSSSGTGEFYNCVVKDNSLQTYGAGISFYDTLAPDINGSPASGANSTVSLPDGTLVNRGNNVHYPLDPDGDWNTGSPGEVAISAAVTDAVVLAEITEALKVDVNGGSRFKGSAIDLGAAEE